VCAEAEHMAESMDKSMAVQGDRMWEASVKREKVLNE